MYNNSITHYFQKMWYFTEVVMWINMCVCLPLTILIIYCVFYAVRSGKVTIIYYTNLLISSLIQTCVMIIWVTRVQSSVCVMIHVSCAMASLYFKMYIALERYVFFAYPLLDCLRQTRSSVLVCVLVWAFCTVGVPLAIVLEDFGRLTIYALLPAPSFILCFAWSCTGIPAATSVPAEVRRRSLGTLVLLFFNYFVMTLPTMIYPILEYGNKRFKDSFGFQYLVSVLFLLCPYVDLILFLFLRKGCADKLLARLCCCSTDNTVSDVAADHDCD